MMPRNVRDIEVLHMLFFYILKFPVDQVIELLTYYNIKPSHIDTINHLCMKTHIKPRQLSIIKRLLKP